MPDKRDTSLNLSEGVYLNFLKESIPGRQRKPVVEEAEPEMPEDKEEEKEEEE